MNAHESAAAFCSGVWEDATGLVHRCREHGPHGGPHVCPCGKVQPSEGPRWLRPRDDGDEGFSMLGRGMDDE